jgi:light-regulated signal transduction histidine kinase (bacteriophytochrome)
MGNYRDACDFLSSAIEYFGSNRSFELAMVRIAMGECLFKVGKNKEGLNNLYEAEDILFTLDNKQELSKIYQLLSTFLKADNQFEKCIYYLEKYNESLKYFFDIEKTNALTRAKKEFETEQKDKESVILRHKNEEIKRYVYKLENSNNSLKQFAHVASHDLREPLRMISCYMTLLEKSLGNQINEQQKDFLGFATDGARRMEQMILDMLQLSKVDANPKIETIKLTNVIDEIRLNLDVLLKEKNAMIFATALPEMKADRTQIVQLLQNLISNGLKYNESASPIIRVKHTQMSEGFEISIADNGIGIPEEYRERVFDIFRRLPTAKAYSGTGIGLSICKKIVDSMNGKINIVNNPSGGTIFKLYFKNEI